jgi:formate dehydrogenase major subunit
MPTVNITINGQKITAQAGQTIIQAAQAAGIDIPVLCNHPALEAWGACRICLVEVAKQRGLHPACTFPVTEGMEVQTETEKVVNIRKFVLELLFSERNHYCMFCEMSGDCELQNLAYRYGLDHWMYNRPYEKMPVDATRKYFIMDHNRCVLCRRCVRACGDVAASHTLGVRERGAHSMIMADHNVPFGESTCVECGTCLQVCPTGALVDRKSAYGGREKDVTHTETTCMHCSVGCALDVVTRHQRLLRVQGAWDKGPSQGLLCVRGRFEPLYDTRERLETPLVRRDGKLVEASWDDALKLVAAKMKGAGATGIAAGATTNEALGAFAALFQKAKGSAGRLEATLPRLGYGKTATVQDVLESDFVVVADVDPLAKHRVVGYFIKRALDHGARLGLIGTPEGGLDAYANLSVGDGAAAQVVELAKGAEKPVVVYGAGLTATAIEGLRPLAEKALFLGLEPDPNGQGELAAGLVPIKSGKPNVLFVFLGEHEEAAGFSAGLNGAFTVVQAAYRSPLTDKADVVLPASIWAERKGHVTNLAGQTSAVTPVLDMPAGVRDETDVWKTLAGLL